MNATATLPIWVLLVFCIVLIGVVTLVYSRGNWRTTLIFVFLSSFAVLTITGIDAWSDYIKLHFVGQFDQLGIPYREAGPGFSLVPSSWPLWLVPTGIFTGLAIIVGWYLRPLFVEPSEKVTAVEEKSAAKIMSKSAIPPVQPMYSETESIISRQLELESLKQELTSTKEKLNAAIDIAEEQVDKNQDLEIKLAQIEEEHQENVTDLEDKIAALELEISAKDAQNDELTSLALQQAEEIARLNEKLTP